MIKRKGPRRRQSLPAGQLSNESVEAIDLDKLLATVEEDDDSSKNTNSRDSYGSSPDTAAIANALSKRRASGKSSLSDESPLDPVSLSNHAWQVDYWRKRCRETEDALRQAQAELTRLKLVPALFRSDSAPVVDKTAASPKKDLSVPEKDAISSARSPRRRRSRSRSRSLHRHSSDQDASPSPAPTARRRRGSLSSTSNEQMNLLAMSKLASITEVDEHRRGSLEEDLPKLIAAWAEDDRRMARRKTISSLQGDALQASHSAPRLGSSAGNSSNSNSSSSASAASSSPSLLTSTGGLGGAMRTRSPFALRRTTSDLFSPESKPAAPTHLLDFKGNAHKIELHERLGRGGAASVYRGSLFGVSFAVKRCDVQEMTVGGLGSFEREASLMHALDHPNVVRCLGHDVHEGSARIFLELFSGTLRDVFDERREDEASARLFRRTAPHEQLRVLADCAAGLAFLHGKNMIHRDVKAENVFVQYMPPHEQQLDPRYAPANVGRVALGDFGESTAWKRKQLFDVNVGTPEFMAPEVAGFKKSEQKRYTDRCDIWSFGMLIFEALTYDVPYRAEEIPPFDLSQHIMSGQRPQFVPMGRVTEEMDGPLLRVFRQCTELNPKERPSAKDLLKDLQKLSEQVEQKPSNE